MSWPWVGRVLINWVQSLLGAGGWVFLLWTLGGNRRKSHSTDWLEQRWRHFQISRVGQVSTQAGNVTFEDITWVLYNFAPISVSVNSPGIMGYWSRKEPRGPASQNFHFTAEETAVGKVTRGHTAGQLNSQHLISGFLILVQCSPPCCPPVTGWSKVPVWDYLGFKIENLIS